jgi:hypothetical protein
MEYEVGWGSETVTFNSSQKDFGIKILISNHRPLNENDRQVLREAADQIENKIVAENFKHDPKVQENRKKERANIIALFPQPIWVDEIPNGYCSRSCCTQIPWFIVTTPVGRIKLGWRKRVIEMSWEETSIQVTARELFPEEDVTREGKLIHAWGYFKAKEYIQKLMEHGSSQVE